MANNNDKIIEILMDVRESMGRLEEKAISIEKKQDYTNGRVNGLEEQVKKNTAFIDNVKGKVAIIAALFVFISNLVINWLKKEFGL